MSMQAAGFGTDSRLLSKLGPDAVARLKAAAPAVDVDVAENLTMSMDISAEGEIEEDMDDIFNT